MSTFFSWIFGGTIVKWLLGGFVALFSVSLLYVVHDYKSQAVTIQKQKDQITSLKNAATVQNANRSLDAETIRQLDAKVKGLQEPGGDLETYCDALAAVKADKSPDADKKVSPAVGNALKTLGSRRRRR